MSMKYKTMILGLLASGIILFSGVSCEKGHEAGGTSQSSKGEKRELTFTPIMEMNQVSSAMNSHAEDYTRSSLKYMKESFVELGISNSVQYPKYARVRKMSDGSYILIWHNASNHWDNNGATVHYALSPDLKNWTYMGPLWEAENAKSLNGNTYKKRYTNGNALLLKNGDLMAVAYFWIKETYEKATNPDPYSTRHDHGVITKISSDCGKTWHSEKVISRGTHWEPHLMYNADGELHCYFSEGRPWIGGSHSGTSMVLSKDGGQTWEPSPTADPYRVMRKKWHSDKDNADFFTYQMPVGVLLNGTSQMAFAMETVDSRDVNNNQTYSLSVVFSPEDGKWENLQGDAVSQTKAISNIASGGGPYLVQFPSGETVVSYSHTKDYMMHTQIGSAMADNFGSDRAMLPYTGSWGGMEVETPHSLLCVRTNTTDGTENSTIVLGRYILNHSIKATPRTVELDGQNSEWKNTDEALYLGEASSDVSATIRCSQDSKYMYFLIEVRDRVLSTSDSFTLLLSPKLEGDRLGSAARRIRMNLNGLKSTDKYSGGWNDMPSDVVVKSSYDGDFTNSKDEDYGYLLEVRVPRSFVDASSGEILMNASLYDALASQEDAICNTADVNTKRWIAIKGL